MLEIHFPFQYNHSETNRHWTLAIHSSTYSRSQTTFPLLRGTQRRLISSIVGLGRRRCVSWVCSSGTLSLCTSSPTDMAPLRIGRWPWRVCWRTARAPSWKFETWRRWRAKSTQLRLRSPRLWQLIRRRYAGRSATPRRRFRGSIMRTSWTPAAIFAN